MVRLADYICSTSQSDQLALMAGGRHMLLHASYPSHLRVADGTAPSIVTMISDDLVTLGDWPHSTRMATKRKSRIGNSSIGSKSFGI